MISGSSNEINDYYGYYSTVSPSGKRLRRMRRTQLSNEKKSNNSSKNLSSQKSSTINNIKSKLNTNKNSNILKSSQLQSKNLPSTNSQNGNLFSTNNSKETTNQIINTPRRNRLQINTGVVGIKMSSLSPSIHLNQPSKVVLVNQSTSNKKGSKIKKQKSILYVQYNNFMTDLQSNNQNNQRNSIKISSSKDLSYKNYKNVKDLSEKLIPKQTSSYQGNQYCFGIRNKIVSGKNIQGTQTRKQLDSSRKNMQRLSIKNDKSVADLSITSSKQKQRHKIKQVQSSPKLYRMQNHNAQIKPKKGKISKHDLVSLKQKNLLVQTPQPHKNDQYSYNKIRNCKQTNFTGQNYQLSKQSNLTLDNISPQQNIINNQYLKKSQNNKIVTQKTIKMANQPAQNTFSKTEKLIKVLHQQNQQTPNKNKPLNAPNLVQNPYHLNKNEDLVNKFNKKKIQKEKQITQSRRYVQQNLISSKNLQQQSDSQSVVSDSQISIASSKRGRRLVRATRNSPINNNEPTKIKSKSRKNSSIIIQPRTPQPYSKYHQSSQQSLKKSLQNKKISHNQLIISASDTKNVKKSSDYNPSYYTPNPHKSKYSQHVESQNSNFKSIYQSDRSSIVSNLQSDHQDELKQKQNFEPNSEYQSGIEQMNNDQEQFNYDTKSNASGRSRNPRRLQKSNGKRSILISSRHSDKINLSFEKKIDLKDKIQQIQKSRTRQKLKMSNYVEKLNFKQQIKQQYRLKESSMEKNATKELFSISQQPIRLLNVVKVNRMQEGNISQLNKQQSPKQNLKVDDQLQRSRQFYSKQLLMSQSKSNKKQLQISSHSNLKNQESLQMSVQKTYQPTNNEFYKKNMKQSVAYNDNQVQYQIQNQTIKSSKTHNKGRNSKATSLKSSAINDISNSKTLNKINQQKIDNLGYKEEAMEEYDNMTNNNATSQSQSLNMDTLTKSSSYNRNSLKNSLYRKQMIIEKVQSQIEEMEQLQVKNNQSLKNSINKQPHRQLSKYVQNKQKTSSVFQRQQRENSSQDNSLGDLHNSNNLNMSKASNYSRTSLQTSKHLKSILSVRSGRNLKPFSLQNPTIQQFINYLDEYELSIGFLYLYTENTQSFYCKQQQQDNQQNKKANTNINKFKNNTKNKKSKRYQQKYQKLSFLMMKKYLYQKNRLIKCLKGMQKNVFTLTGLQIPQKIFKKFINHQQTKQKLKFYQEQTKQIFKSLEEKFRSLRLKAENKKDKLIKLETPYDNFTRDLVNMLLEQLNELTADIDGLEEESGVSQISSNLNSSNRRSKNKIPSLASIIGEQIMSNQQRSIQIMQLIFLLSQLQDRKIKKLQLINISDIDFESYYQSNIDRLLETYQFFQSIKYPDDQPADNEKKRK